MFGSGGDGITHIRRDALRAVVLVIVVAWSALHTTTDLRANTDTVTDLDVFNILSNSHRLSDNLVSNDEREMALAPALLEGVQVRAADTAVGDGDFDVVGAEGLWFEGSDL